MKSVFPFKLQLGIFLVPFLGFLILLWLKLTAEPVYFRIIQEDHLLENQQFLFLLVGSILAAIVARQFFVKRYHLHGWAYVGLALGLFFVAGEEISWGQRIFGIETPERLQERNLQDELTIHNLDFINPWLHFAYIAVGAYGTLAWLGLRLCRPGDTSFWRFVLPDWFLSSWFFFLMIIYIAIDVAQYIQPTVFGREMVIGSFMIYRDQEPAESFWATAMLLFVIDNYLKARRLPGAGETD